jgi:hypothetical protein
MDINTNEPITQIPFPKSEFLDTSLVTEMKGPMGTVSYLEMVTSTTGEEDGIGQIGLQVKNKHIEALTYQVEAEHSKEKMADLRSMGIDLDTEMISVLNNESYLTMEKQLHNKYHDMGIQTYRKSYGKWKSFLNKYFKLEFPIYSEADKICSKILLLSQMTAIRTRRGPANFVVVSPMMASLLMDDPSTIIKTSEIENSMSIYSPMSIADRIKVFIDPKMKYDNMTVILGKTTENGNEGVVTGQYSRQFMKVDSVGAMDFLPITKYQLRDRYVVTDINESSADGFFTVDFVIGKKPLWRKLINA